MNPFTSGMLPRCLLRGYRRSRPTLRSFILFTTFIVVWLHFNPDTDICSLVFFRNQDQIFEHSQLEIKFPEEIIVILFLSDMAHPSSSRWNVKLNVDDRRNKLELMR